jgi:hypothetical protein
VTRYLYTAKEEAGQWRGVIFTTGLHPVGQTATLWPTKNAAVIAASEEFPTTEED